MDGNDIRRLLIQGAVPKGSDEIPNRGWGYGAVSYTHLSEFGIKTFLAV